MVGPYTRPGAAPGAAGTRRTVTRDSENQTLQVRVRVWPTLVITPHYIQAQVSRDRALTSESAWPPRATRTSQEQPDAAIFAARIPVVKISFSVVLISISLGVDVSGPGES